MTFTINHLSNPCPQALVLCSFLSFLGERWTQGRWPIPGHLPATARLPCHREPVTPDAAPVSLIVAVSNHQGADTFEDVSACQQAVDGSSDPALDELTEPSEPELARRRDHRILAR